MDIRINKMTDNDSIMFCKFEEFIKKFSNSKLTEKKVIFEIINYFSMLKQALIFFKRLQALIIKISEFLNDPKILKILDRNTINNELLAYKKMNLSEGEELQLSIKTEWNDLFKVNF